MASLTAAHEIRAAPAAQGIGAGPADSDAVPLRRYATFLRNQWPVVIAAMLIGCVLGAVRSATLAPTYTSRVTVLVPPVAVGSGLPPLSEGPFAQLDVKPELNTLDTDAQLVNSGLILEKLRTMPGFRVPEDRLADRITVTASTNSSVLTIGVRADSPGHARAGARVVIRTFLKVRRRVIGHDQLRNRQEINRRIAILEAELKALPLDPTAQGHLVVRTRRQAMMKQILDARGQLSYRDQYAEVLSHPDRPIRPDDPDFDVNATSGVGLGLLGGLLVGLVRERRPRRLRSARDVQRRSSLPVLTDVGLEGIADAGRRLRNLAFAENARTVLVAGLPGETADPIAVSVAAAFAYGGAPTTLLRVGRTPLSADGDGAGAGAGAALSAGAGPAGGAGGAVVPGASGTTASGEAVLGMVGGDGGERAAFQVEALSADDLDRELAAAVGRAHHGSGVVVISGPPLTDAGTLTLAAVADLTFVTVALRQLTDRPLAAAVEDVEKAGVRPRGIVIT